ncbi:MAG: hypothetical protein P4L33_16780 [Capsulimonadaceae bacterium]|nr:hypothetical protein [Capsulimonadaceae bacterium]
MRMPIAQRVRQSRVSQGAGQVLFGKGGLGYIARRGVDMGTSAAVQSLEGLARMAVQQPLELISLLPDVVPEVGLAVWNGVRLGCAPGSVRIKAMTVRADGGSEEDATGTAAINALFDGLPDEVGNFNDCLSRNFLMVMFSGMCAVEAVPGRQGSGLAQVWPVNSLTLRFRREDDGTLALYQRQTADPNGIGIFSSGMGGVYEPMPMERFFYATMDGFPDDPYGRAPFAAALTPVLECLAFIRDMTLAFHRIGMPKIDVALDYEGWARTARDVVGITDPTEIDNWVVQKQQEVVNIFAGLQPDDAFFHGVNDKVNSVGAGDKMPDLPGIWSMLRLRLIQGLKQMPSLMGVVEGSTETWSNVDWQIYAKGLESIVSKAAAPLVKSANLHLRLLGLPLKAAVEIEPVRANQRLTDAQAEALEIANEARKRDEGWTSQETAAMAVTGSGPVGQGET